MTSFYLELSQTNSEQQIINALKPSNSYQLISIKSYENFYPSSQQQSNLKFLGYLLINEISSEKPQKVLNQHKYKMKMRKVCVFEQKSKKQQQDQEKKYQIQSNTIEYQLTLPSETPKEILIKKLNNSNFLSNDNQTGYLILSQPLQVYFITTKHPQAIKVNLPQQCPKLQIFISYFSFQSQSNNQSDEVNKKQTSIPFLFVQGNEKQTNRNVMFMINLTTYEIKIFYENKNDKVKKKQKSYCPDQNQHSFKLFNDGRLYIFGGINQGKNNEEQLLWSYDLEKGYWFALQMKYQQVCNEFNNSNYTLYDSGKVIIEKDNQFYLLQLYQCKISKLQIHPSQIEQVKQIKQIRTLFSFQKKIFLYSSGSVAPELLQLRKIKLTFDKK